MCSLANPLLLLADEGGERGGVGQGFGSGNLGVGKHLAQAFDDGLRRGLAVLRGSVPTVPAESNRAQAGGSASPLRGSSVALLRRRRREGLAVALRARNLFFDAQTEVPVGEQPAFTVRSSGAGGRRRSACITTGFAAARAPRPSSAE